MSSDRKAQSVEAKNRGNAFFAQNKFNEAIACFTEAIELDPSNEVFYSNRSASYTSLGQFQLALEDAKRCVELKPEWAKGYSRLGAAYYLGKNYEEAIKAYAKGLTIEPSNQQFMTDLAKANQMLDTRRRVEAEVAEARRKQEEDELKQAEERKQKEEDEKLNSVIIGIDLGTTYSCVGVWLGDRVEIISNELGDRTTPSWVAFRPDGERLIGAAAMNQASSNPYNTLFDIKRIIGQRFADAGVETDCRRFPFKVVSGPEDKPVVEVEYRNSKHQFVPEQISAMILSRMKQTAEQYLGHPIKKAVVTVPAYFSDAQRQATKLAGAIAGLDVVRILNEPTAAALAYGLDRNRDGANVLIFDLGGGTFDVSLLNLSGGIFEVLSTAGDTHLGGEDFDNATLEFLVKEAKRLGLPDISENQRALRRLKVAAERAKRQLSDGVEADIYVESLAEGQDFRYTLSRARFESLNKRLFTRCLDTVKRVLKDANMKVENVDDIVLVGGSTRIPKIQEILQEFFNGKELCKSLNPDEAVAYGAAVQGAILGGSRHEQHQLMLLMDVTPLSLGIETTGRVMSTIIKRNTQIPCRKSQIFTTEENYQTAVDISVYEGERKTTDGNNLLGEFTITGIERAKRGEPQIEVTFDIDANGILTVAARDLKTDATAQIEIKNRGQVSQADVARMIYEAQQFEREDQQRLQKIEARNELERVIYQVMDAARATNDRKLGGVLERAAQNCQNWIDENADTLSVSEIQAKIRQMEKRMQGMTLSDE